MDDSPAKLNINSSLQQAKSRQVYLNLYHKACIAKKCDRKVATGCLNFIKLKFTSYEYSKPHTCKTWT